MTELLRLLKEVILSLSIPKPGNRLCVPRFQSWLEALQCLERYEMLKIMQVNEKDVEVQIMDYTNGK